MDWNAAIERHHEALKRVLAALVAMAGFAGLSSPLAGEDGSARRGDPSAEAQRAKAEAEALAEPGEGCSSPTPTLPRHLYRAVLRLLRPAEAAARRLIIVAARGLVVDLPPPRPRKPDPLAAHAALRRFGIAVVLSPAEIAAHARAARAAAARAAARAARPRSLSLSLLDPLKNPLRRYRRYVPAHAAPRILSLDGAAPHRLPPPPSPDDPIDASRLALRFAALARALDDLPGQARRFARWQARRNAGRIRRTSPLRPGRPPGQRSRNSRWPAHEVHDVLTDLHGLAFDVLVRPDTS